MKELFENMKSPEQIKTQIEFWFVKYFRMTREEFNGTELFTLFDLLTAESKKKIIEQMTLRVNELPVLLLTISNDQMIVNTTERFIRLRNLETEYIDYADFECHDGFKSILATIQPDGKSVSIKTDGYISEFGLRKKSGEIVPWQIPTGTPGFGFWNVTKNCELIGRKYQQKE